MNLIGVDVGSDSLRVSIRDDRTGTSHDRERLLVRTQEGNKHTMSGPDLWAQIVLMLVDHDEQYSALNSASSGKEKTYMLQNTQTNIESHPLCSREQSDQEVENVPGAPVDRRTHAAQNAPEASNRESKVPSFPPSAVCVAATCSMVVMHRVHKNGRSYFRPVEPGAEVIVWMDTRARVEAPWVSRRLPEPALAQIGGTVTPEMGVAKLKWISNNASKLNSIPGLQTPNSDAEICVFELYDWVTYLFLAGGYGADGLVACLADDVPKFAPGLMAMDGSVKGWGSDILETLEISKNVHVCCTPNRLEPQTPFPFVGTPLGSLGRMTVAHGCIDCYAGWAGQVATAGAKKDGPALGNKRYPDSAPRSETKPNLHSTAEKDKSSPCSLLMVAGTSTCFIASVDQRGSAEPIPGLWGPFAQLLASPVYSFGQPATGQLFSELFAEHSDLIGDMTPFVFVEENAREIEHNLGHSLPVLARHYLYYGDKHGNRSPYGDFRMGEICVSGTNASGPDLISCNLHGNTIESLVVKYYLAVEFLVFQTAQLCRRLSAVCGPVGDVYISGSQAQNVRLVEMLAVVAFPESRVFIRKGTDTKFSGSQGISLAMTPYIPRDFCSKFKADACVFPDPSGSWIQVAPPADLHARVEDELREKRILLTKYGTFEALADWQTQFRAKMGGL